MVLEDGKLKKKLAPESMEMVVTKETARDVEKKSTITKKTYENKNPDGFIMNELEGIDYDYTNNESLKNIDPNRIKVYIPSGTIPDNSLKNFKRMAQPLEEKNFEKGLGGKKFKAQVVVQPIKPKR